MNGSRIRVSAVCVAALIAGAVFASGAGAARTHCSNSYSYAGLIGSNTSYGVRTKLTVVKDPDVREGHVAGWVGVGGQGMGPNGTTEWIQVGYSGYSWEDSTLYYEVKRPKGYPQYTAVQTVEPGESHNVGVTEMRGRKNWWRVWVDGKAVSKPIFLPGSHGAWEPVATAESWNADSGRCNSFAYRFGRVAFATGPNRGWTLLRDADKLEDTGYQVRRWEGGFTARGTI